MATDLTVANTILEQLGGRKFLAMTGARNLIGSSNGLTFRLPRFHGVACNAISITLDPSDTYTVKFMRIHGNKLRDLSTHDGIYCDMLRELFTRETGLDTSLGSARGLDLA